MTTRQSWKNPVRLRLAAGQPVFGLTISLPSPEIAAHAATLGFHFLWIEMEHSPISLESLRGIVLATRGLPAQVFARVPAIELWQAKRVLDQGVSGVIFPFTTTADKAATAAAATKYPPLGRRGSGAGAAVRTWPQQYGSYYDSADANVMTICVIEESRALEDIDAIAATPGIDVLFIGTSDLSFSLGLRGRQDDPGIAQAIARIRDAAARHGKVIGRPAASVEEVRRFMADGFLFFQMCSEIGLMDIGARHLLDPLGIAGIPPDQRSLY
jgi:2-keto-3-deoxy-L-rhamnonate aldolase RhmA